MTPSCPPVILLLGQTGVGKSTFINSAAGCLVTPVGSELTSCTKHVKDFEVSVVTGHNQTQKVILIDTPGFNDTWEGDAVILEQLRTWLRSFSESYPSSRFAGIIYLYDITQARNITNGDTLVTPNKFEHPPLVTNLHFVATHCAEVNSNLVLSRENELREKYWAKMLKNGAETSRLLENNQPLTHGIISRILVKPPFTFSEVLNKLDDIHSRLKSPNPAHWWKNGIFSRLFGT